MKAALACLAALTAISLAPAIASAQYCYPGQPCYPAQMMPGMYDGGICPTPPFPPYSGIPPYGLNLQQYQQACYGQQAGYGQMGGYGQQGGYNPQAGYGPVNWQCLPWYRGPRDFFMWSEAQKEILTRETRPPFIP